MDFVRGEILFDPLFEYPDGDGVKCKKLLLVVNKNHCSPEDVVTIPAKRNIRNYPYKDGCNEPESVFYFSKQIGFYRATSVIQFISIIGKPCGWYEEMIKKKRIDRLNKYTTPDELGRIINCLKRVKDDIPEEYYDLIF